jgi:hypothetical protein
LSCVFESPVGRVPSYAQYLTTNKFTRGKSEVIDAIKQGTNMRAELQYLQKRGKGDGKCDTY